MNRYLLAALYVMAGCAVTIPLRIQDNAEFFRGDGCRPIVSSALKVVAVCLEECEDKCYSLCHQKQWKSSQTQLSDDNLPVFSHDFSGITTLCPMVQKIRAPGGILYQYA